MRRSALLLALVAALRASMPVAAAPVTPASVLASAPARDWRAVASDHLMLIDLADGKRVTIALAPGFAPVHVANIEALVRAGWFDGLWVSRVQDDYVAQWGDPDDRKPLPAAIVRRPPAEYEQPAARLRLRPLPYRDSFATRVGFVDGWPVAEDSGRAWLTHCYGMVGAGRNNHPDTGTGAELYAVIGHAPRALDRNIALVGRVIDGMAALSSLPRGTADLGFYATAAERRPIVRVRMASDLPAAERPAYLILRSDSASFARWLGVKANRRDDFYIRPAGAIDLCNALPPVRPARR